MEFFLYNIIPATGAVSRIETYQTAEERDRVYEAVTCGSEILMQQYGVANGTWDECFLVDSANRVQSRH